MTQFWFWKYVVSIFAPGKKEREYIFQQHCDKELSLSSVHMCMHYAQVV